MQTQKFNFKSRTIRDENGREIGKTKKQPSLDAAIPSLTAEETVSVLANPESSEAKLLLSHINDLFYQAARRQFDDIIESFGDSDAELTAGMLDTSKLTLDYLASLPPSQRGVTAISEDEWNQFYADYQVVIPAATGKAPKIVENHVNAFKKPMRYKNAKPILDTLVTDLNVYVMRTQILEETGQCANRLINKFTKWIAESEQAVDRDAF